MDQSPFIVGGEGKGEDFRRDHSLFWGKLTANEGGGSNKNTTKLRGCGGGGTGKSYCDTTKNPPT